MTENEARLILDVRISRFDHAGDVNEALEIAKQALKEVQQYREIGTVEECREAVEKQKGMQVNEIHVDEYFCPACGSENNCDYGKVHDKYCPICGHAIYQEESEEK